MMKSYLVNATLGAEGGAALGLTPLALLPAPKRDTRAVLKTARHSGAPSNLVRGTLSSGSTPSTSSLAARVTPTELRALHTEECKAR